MRLPIALAAAALIVATATLHLHVAVVQPPDVSVRALLFPLGDAPGGPFDRDKTLYVSGYGFVRYATVAAFGRAVLNTNTSGWYMFYEKFPVPPIVASRRLPPPGRHISVQSAGGALIEIYNYDDEYGVVELLRGSGRFAWAAKILDLGDYYFWYPIEVRGVAYAGLRSFIEKTGRYIYLFMPSRDYIAVNNRNICIYADYYDGNTWHEKDACLLLDIDKDFKPLDPNVDYVVDGLEWVGGVDVWIYWPVVAAYWGNATGGDVSTYLRARAS
jgi:hypothetical protein